ncbi:MAG: HEAT repeat domain-containing protein [Terriglobia bacterium]
MLFLIMALVMLFVLVPFLFWRGTWFGRPLTDQQIGQYLADAKQPRKTQHALAQIAERLLRGDPSVRQWYPQVLALANHPLTELRVVTAWVMGHDNQSEEFHQSLLGLLEDPEPMVRHNAALSLVRFGDARGRPELLSMLRSYWLRAGAAGTVRFRLKVADAVNPGTLVARIERGADDFFEVRSPLPGHLAAKLADDGDPVEVGDAILLLAPAAEQAWEALRALYLVGQPEDLPDVDAIVVPFGNATICVCRPVAKLKNSMVGPAAESGLK